MSLSQPTVTPNYSAFDYGYAHNPLASKVNPPMMLVPFSYKTAINQEGDGLDHQVNKLNATSEHKQMYMSNTASISRLSTHAALSDLHQKGFAVATPGNGGNVFNIVKSHHYDVQSSNFMDKEPPVVISGNHPPMAYTSIYRAMQDNSQNNPSKVPAETFRRR